MVCVMQSTKTFIFSIQFFYFISHNVTCEFYLKERKERKKRMRRNRMRKRMDEDKEEEEEEEDGVRGAEGGGGQERGKRMNE